MERIINKLNLTESGRYKDGKPIYHFIGGIYCWDDGKFVQFSFHGINAALTKNFIERITKERVLRIIQRIIKLTNGSKEVQGVH